jgi:hypothetical protein
VIYKVYLDTLKVVIFITPTNAAHVPLVAGIIILADPADIDYDWHYVEDIYNTDRHIPHEIEILQTSCNTLLHYYNIQNLNPFLYICYDTASRSTL